MAEYKKLRVWKAAHALALNAHRTALSIRGQQYASFRSQITRSAMSIPANIVEGREQRTDAAFARFLRIALGSASELEYHLTAARELGIIPKSRFLSLASEVETVRMMLHGLLKILERGDKRPMGSSAGG